MSPSLQISKIGYSLYIWLPSCVCALIIFFASTSHLDVPRYVPSQDKFLHTIAYIGFSGCFYRSLYKAFFAPRWILFCISVICVSFYGAGIEIYQPYCGRCFEWLDIGVNTLGAIIGTGCYAGIAKFYSRLAI